MVEPPSDRAYLRYTEDISKTNQGGLAHRRKEPKQVIHYENIDNPERCLIRLYKLYMSKCPKDRPDSAFYLKPLNNPKADCWFCKILIGHNVLQQIIPNLFKAAGIEGHYTNHLLRATGATRLFEAQVDEQLIMQRTGDTSTAVRSYKRIGQKLKSVTSDALNSASTSKKGKNEMCQPLAIAKNEGSCKEKENCDHGMNRCPMSFAGASHFTVNINYGTALR